MDLPGSCTESLNFFAAAFQTKLFLTINLSTTFKCNQSKTNANNIKPNYFLNINRNTYPVISVLNHWTHYRNCALELPLRGCCCNMVNMLGEKGGGDISICFNPILLPRSGTVQGVRGMIKVNHAWNRIIPLRPVNSTGSDERAKPHCSMFASRTAWAGGWQMNFRELGLKTDVRWEMSLEWG